MSTSPLAEVEKPVGIARLRDFVTSLADLLAEPREEAEILDTGSKLLARLVAHDDWLPEEFTRPHPDRYQQYLLHCDSRERFSVVSFVWGPGQGTPIHDHRVWGLIGVLRGSEQSERYTRAPDGTLRSLGAPEVLHPGEVEAVSPRIGDIHRVWNALPDRPSISIHVYGGNIGAVERATYAPDGAAKRFISGYASGLLPNIWDRSNRA
ncbi:cysteine dioxygenase type I [Novosphingobium nitrogenifigens DSM 19370]|uniref:Cysteine dioxygenase type I n=1 Tax=Novosphingobium nitrogenifigens DSM 19370 TaxID=983920 RepID=F1Z7E9_9SPHN|nr:cysteine dioxygenase [Novosphingobium nitrogenifigens]EGD59461.1 cysteine dioxygenase type I [Novosphingobium nitrogenifigens DSM 19370]